MPVLTPDTENNREIVEQWLDEFSFTREQCDTAFDQTWGIAAKDDTGFTTKVFWRKPPASSILFLAEITFPDVYQQAFNFMGVADKMLFLGDIGRCLHAQSVGHELLSDGSEDDDEDSLPPPKGINIYVNILADDGISRPVFFKHYYLIRGKAQELALLFQRMALLRRWT